MMKPVRVLHVLGAMNRGGVETWLMHVLRNIDRDRFQMTLLVHTDQLAAYDTEAQSLGARIVSCPATHRPSRYAKRFLEIAKQFGPFDVLHSHVHNFSGYVAWLGHVAGIPVRIAHSHNDTRILNESANTIRTVYLALTQWLLTKYSTCRLAASESAAAALFGPAWRQDPLVKILYCGIDLRPYSLAIDRAGVRSEFGFHPSNIVFAHVGRFDPQKNHTFLIDIVAEIAKRNTDARFLLVGDGPLRPSIETKVRRAGLASRTVFAGSRADVPRLMVGAMDTLLFPSLYEGLGLVLIEAQAAKLQAIISDTIPPEAIVVPDLVRSISLKQPAAVWAEAALQHRESNASNALEVVGHSPFSILRSVDALREIYDSPRH